MQKASFVPNSQSLLFFILSVGLITALTSCNSSPTPLEPFEIDQLDVFQQSTSIRALKVVDDEEVWFAGAEGIYGYTKDGGQNWVVDSIQTDTIIPHFRSIAITDSAIFLLSIGSPALLYRSSDEGQNWAIVYREEHPSAFYDAMAFWDNQYGMAMGDPTDGCLSVIRTEDAGKSWIKVSCDHIPEAGEGEAAFAASNSNITLNGENAWMVSGGGKARVYKSTNKGQDWEAYETPIIEGGQMTGIYSIAFFDESNGIIFGGDWNNKKSNVQNKAITIDGGKSWNLIADGQGPGYRSHVRYIPDTDGLGIIACGIPGLSHSVDGGMTWKDLIEEDFYTLDFGNSGNVLWLAGNRKIGKITFL